LTNGAGAAGTVVVAVGPAAVSTGPEVSAVTVVVVEEWSTTYSSTISSCLMALADFGEALANRPPPTVAIATHAIPRVAVAETA
jgi:hypothetical protein